MRLVVPVAAERGVDPAGHHRRHEVGADVDLLDRAGRDPGVGEDRRAGRRAGRGCRRRRPSCRAARATRVICLEPSEMIEVSGRCTIAAIDDQRQPVVAGQQQLGLVGDRRVDLARRDAASAAWRGRWGPATWTSSPAWREVAVGQRPVEADVVGIGQPVEHQAERLGLGGRRRRACPSSRRRRPGPGRPAARRAARAHRRLIGRSPAVGRPTAREPPLGQGQQREQARSRTATARPRRRRRGRSAVCAIDWSNR